MENTTQTPQGKGMAVAGFVISLIALVLYIVIAGIVALSALVGGGYGLGIFWLLLSLSGAVLSILGMMKLGKTGGKKGLAITGMILGIVATLFSASLVMGIGKIQDSAKAAGIPDATEIGNAVKSELGTAVQEGLKTAADSIKNAE